MENPVKIFPTNPLTGWLLDPNERKSDLILCQINTEQFKVYLLINLPNFKWDTYVTLLIEWLQVYGYKTEPGRALWKQFSF